MDDGYSAELLPRSGVGRKYGVRLLNTIGLIDYDFEGEWAVTLDCDKPCSFKRGDRILQCVIRWAARATDIEIESNQRGRGLSRGVLEYEWQGLMDSNHRMTESESVALPLGEAPINGRS